MLVRKLLGMNQNMKISSPALASDWSIPPYHVTNPTHEIVENKISGDPNNDI